MCPKNEFRLGLIICIKLGQAHVSCDDIEDTDIARSLASMILIPEGSNSHIKRNAKKSYM